MSKVKFFVCGNEETVCSGTYLHHAEETDLAGEAVRAACRVIDDNPICDSEVNRIFSDWNGGRFDQFCERFGFVAVYKDAPDWSKRLASEANDAMQAELSKIESEAEQQDREWFAQCLDNEDDINEWLITEILFPSASFKTHTRESIAKALRANNPSLLVVAE